MWRRKPRSWNLRDRGGGRRRVWAVEKQWEEVLAEAAVPALFRVQRAQRELGELRKEPKMGAGEMECVDKIRFYVFNCAKL